MGAGTGFNQSSSGGGGGGTITGSGTINFLAKFTPNGTAISNSQLFDNGIGVGIGTITPLAKLGIVSTTGGGEKLISLYSSDWATPSEQERFYLTQGAFYARANTYDLHAAGGGDAVFTVYGSTNGTIKIWSDVAGSDTFSVVGSNMPTISSLASGLMFTDASWNFGPTPVAPIGRLVVNHTTEGQFLLQDNGYLKNTGINGAYMEYDQNSGLVSAVSTTHTRTGFHAYNTSGGPAFIEMVSGGGKSYFNTDSYIEWYANNTGILSAVMNSTGDWYHATTLGVRTYAYGSSVFTVLAPLGYANGTVLASNATSPAESIVQFRDFNNITVLDTRTDGNTFIKKTFTGAGLGSIVTSASLNVKGATSDSTGYTIQATDFANASLFSVRNDGHIVQGTNPFTATYPDINVYNFYSNASWMYQGIYIGADINHHTSNIGTSILFGENTSGIGFWANYGGSGEYNYGGQIYADSTIGRMKIRGGVDGLDILGGQTATVGINIDLAGFVGIGTQAVPNDMLSVKGYTSNSASYGLKVYNSSSAQLFSVRNDGVSTFTSAIEGEGTGTPMLIVESTGGGIRHNYVAASTYSTTIQYYDGVDLNAKFYVGNNGVGIMYTETYWLAQLSTNFKRLALNPSGDILIGDPANIYSQTSRLHVLGSGTTTGYTLKTGDSTNVLTFSIRDDGKIAMPLVQVGVGASVSGDLYFDTAANALLNGDLVCIRKT